MKLDYSSKDRNWQILPADGSSPIRPKFGFQLQPVLKISLVCIAVILVVVLAIGVYPHHFFQGKYLEASVASDAQSVPTPAPAPVIVPLQLPASLVTRS